MESSMKDEALKEYEQINLSWLKFHLEVIVITSLVCIFTEILMMYGLMIWDQLVISVSDYIRKYVFYPSFVNIMINFIAYYTYCSKKIKLDTKKLVLSFCATGIGLVVAYVHNSFVISLLGLCLPPLLTLTYENKKLTSIISFTCIFLELFCAFFSTYDPIRNFDLSYLFNTFVLVVISLCVWMICIYIIVFMQRKRNQIISIMEERQMLRYQINIDPLTLVGNKIALEHEIMRAMENEGQDVYGLVMLDIDYFKQINDTYGHLYGDTVLRFLGRSLRGNIGMHRPYRYGGDEFCILFKGASTEEIKAMIQTVQRDLDEHLEKVSEDQMPVTISSGLAFLDKKDDATSWIRKADQALYQSKRNGRHCFSTYQEI